MKKTIFLSILILFVSNILAQGSFNIQGQIDENNSAELWVHLYYRQKDDYVVDSCLVKDGRFSFSGQVDYPVMAMLGFKHNASMEQEKEREIVKFSTLYNIERTPSNFLLNREGKIIAKNLYGDELLNRVQTILQLSKNATNQ